ncbi:MAG: PfkB family carbohydrate kinase, partial [Gammaproteobacteria bacterium]|nr:PfkB family carbohydrate kinase [Gammaproteobacteria bacterium]
VHTKGSEGLSYLYKSQIFHLPAIPISPVLDTLAAGDVFIGSCLGFLILGHDYESAIARANRVAGKKCMQYGIENLDFG